MAADPRPLHPPEQKAPEVEMQEDHQDATIDPDDPLLIAQTLTYVTDNGSIIMSYSSAPFSSCKLTQTDSNGQYSFSLMHGTSYNVITNIVTFPY